MSSAPNAVSDVPIYVEQQLRVAVPILLSRLRTLEEATGHRAMPSRQRETLVAEILKLQAIYLRTRAGGASGMGAGGGSRGRGAKASEVEQSSEKAAKVGTFSGTFLRTLAPC